MLTTRPCFSRCLRVNALKPGDAYMYQWTGSLTYWGPDKTADISQTTLSTVFLDENKWISINGSLKFIPKGPVNNIPALVQIMAWHRPGNKPLPEPMMASLLPYICVTRPQCVNGSGNDLLLPSHYPSQCDPLSIKTWRDKIQWNLNQNINLFGKSYFIQASMG